MATEQNQIRQFFMQDFYTWKIGVAPRKVNEKRRKLLLASGNEAVFRGRVQLLWLIFSGRGKRPAVRTEFKLFA
jgi:hypothetical protein